MHNTFKKHIQAIIDKLDYPKIDVQVQIPKEINHGDLTTNTAMILAKEIKQNPLKIAKKITQILDSEFSDYYQDINIAGPGFINIKLNKNTLISLVKEIKSCDKNYGRNKKGQNKKLVFPENIL